jgi:hypothetical protein
LKIGHGRRFAVGLFKDKRLGLVCQAVGRSVLLIVGNTTSLVCLTIKIRN